MFNTVYVVLNDKFQLKAIFGTEKEAQDYIDENNGRRGFKRLQLIIYPVYLNFTVEIPEKYNYDYNVKNLEITTTYSDSNSDWTIDDWDMK